MPQNKFLTYIYTLAKSLYNYSSIPCLENKLPNVANLFAITFQYAFSITATMQIAFMQIQMVINSGFYPCTFVYSRISPKIQFFQCLLSLVVPWGDHMVNNEGKMFEIQVCRLLENVFVLGFSWNFRVSLRVLNNSRRESCIKPSFTYVCKYLNQRGSIGEQMENSSRVFQKQKRKKTQDIVIHNSIQD